MAKKPIKIVVEFEPEEAEVTATYSGPPIPADLVKQLLDNAFELLAEQATDKDGRMTNTEAKEETRDPIKRLMN